MAVSAVKVSTKPFHFDGDALPLKKISKSISNKKAASRAAAAGALCKLHTRAVPGVTTPEERETLTLQHRAAARKLALSMISKWKCRIESDELQSVIDLALCEAASRFNKKQGAAFMTFLYFHLKGKLIRTITERADKSLVFIDDYEQPRPMVLGDEASCDVCSTEWVSIGAADSNPFAVEDNLYRQQLIDICYKACQRLRGIERDVIWRLYFENKELNQITAELGYSRGHLFRVRMRALNKIRRAVAAQA